MTFIFLPSVSLPPSHRDVQPWTETACSHLVYRYPANRTVSTATGCAAPVLPGVKRNVLARAFLNLFNEVASIYCLRIGIRLCKMN
jgi:hypothetical protein